MDIVKHCVLLLPSGASTSLQTPCKISMLRWKTEALTFCCVIIDMYSVVTKIIIANSNRKSYGKSTKHADLSKGKGSDQEN